MTTFPDLDHYEDDTTTDTLTLPISGRRYTFSSRLAFGRALQFQKMRAEGQRMLDEKIAAEKAEVDYQFEPSPEIVDMLAGINQTDLYLELIGDEMKQKLIDDHVLWDKVLHVGTTLYAWHMTGREAALRVWTRGKLEDGDVRPPDVSTDESRPSKTSPRSSSRKTPAKSKAPGSRSHGATTSTGGHSSKRTSSANTTST